MLCWSQLPQPEQQGTAWLLDLYRTIRGIKQLWKRVFWGLN